MADLIPTRNRVDGDPEGLHSRLTELESVLRERDAEFTTARDDLAAFKINYRQQVGILHEQLDELELQIAEAELEIITGVRESRPSRPNEAPAERPEALPRFTSDAVRKLFRDVAKVLHPDLARDELARNRRHQLMIEANRAYALGDEQQLRWLLEAWERSPDAVQGSDAEAMRQRLVRRMAQVEEQLAALASDLAALQESPIWKLKAMVDEAAAGGKDLVGDMVKRLQRDIMAATNRLDALRPLI